MNILNLRASLLLLMAMFVMALRVDGSNICNDPWIDAMVQMPSGDTYAFRGTQCYLLIVSAVKERITTIADGYPQPITTEFPGLPNNIDAALAFGNSTYFFKDWYFYQYIGGEVVRVGKIHDQFPRVPDKLNAAFEREVDPTNIDGTDPFFLKESSYYEYLGETVIHGSIWNWGWPIVNPDAATRFYRIFGVGVFSPVTIFVFKGIYYYILDFGTLEVVPGFPRETGPAWFGCE